MQAGGKMVKHELQRFMNRLFSNQMIVIQNQCGVLRKRHQFVDERSQSACQQSGLWGVQQSERCLSDRRAAVPECGNHIGPEACRVVVLFIKHQPRDRTGALASPDRE